METQDSMIKEIESTINFAKAKVGELSESLNSKFDDLAESSKEQLIKTVEGIEQKKPDVELKLLILKDAADSAKDDMIIGTQMAYEDLKEAIRSAEERF